MQGAPLGRLSQGGAGHPLKRVSGSWGFRAKFFLMFVNVCVIRIQGRAVDLGKGGAASIDAALLREVLLVEQQ